MAHQPQPPQKDQPERKGPTDRREFFRDLILGGLKAAGSQRGASIEDLDEAAAAFGRSIIHMTRRKALAVLGGTAAVAAYYTVMNPVIPELFDFSTTDFYDKETREAMDFLEKRYGCRIEFGIPMDSLVKLTDLSFNKLNSFLEKEHIHFGNIGLQEKRNALKIARKALAKYPPEYLQNIRPVIVFAKYKKALMRGGWALSQGGNHMIAVTASDLLDEDAEGETGEIEGTLHHELEHAADAHDGWETLSKTMSPKADIQNAIWVNNEEWANLNPRGKETYHYWSELLRYIFGNPEHTHQGFVRNYGRMNPDEDQATIAEYLMMANNEGDAIDYFNEQIEKDPVLKAKILKLKEYMTRRSKGRMNEQYWKDLKAGQVNEAYWDIH